MAADTCWALEFPGALSGASGPLRCEGRLQRAHLVPQSLMKRELGEEGGLVCARCGSAAGEPCRGRSGKALKGFHSERRDEWLRIVWDPRVWRLLCERHHHALDKTRRWRPQRWHLPAELEVFALEHGLGWWLDREYGDGLSARAS